jgi:hypothetical protein
LGQADVRMRVEAGEGGGDDDAMQCAMMSRPK